MAGRGGHRRPPRPLAYWTAKRGWCRLCGKPIVEGGIINARKHWHPLCAVRWKIMNQPTETRRYVYKRDKGRCAVCGVVTSDWEADHIVPLRHATAPEHWMLQNLQSLCRVHHLAKTNADRVKYAMS